MRSPRRVPGTPSRRGSSAVDRTPTHSTQNDKPSTFSPSGILVVLVAHAASGKSVSPRPPVIDVHSHATPTVAARPDTLNVRYRIMMAVPVGLDELQSLDRTRFGRGLSFPCDHGRASCLETPASRTKRIFRIQHGCVPKSRMAESRHLGKSFHSTWACLRPILTSIRTGRSRRNSTFLSEFTWGLVHRTRRTSRARRRSSAGVSSGVRQPDAARGGVAAPQEIASLRDARGLANARV